LAAVTSVFPDIDFHSPDGMLKRGADRWDFEPFSGNGFELQDLQDRCSLRVKLWRTEDGPFDGRILMELAARTGWTGMDNTNGDLITPKGYLPFRSKKR
jgi:hypothetical protein